MASPLDFALDYGYMPGPFNPLGLGKELYDQLTSLGLLGGGKKQAPANVPAAAKAAAKAADKPAPATLAPDTKLFTPDVRKAMRTTQVPFRPAEPAPDSPAPKSGGKSAFSMNAPQMNDRVDSSGKVIPGAQSFVRGLFASADSAQKALEAYKKSNPRATAATDTYLGKLESDAAQAQQDAQAGTKWAAMPESARGAVLTQGAKDAAYAKGRDVVGALDQQRLDGANSAGKEIKVGGNTHITTDLNEDAKYFEQTGVMRGGAGLGTSTTVGGGVIKDEMIPGTGMITGRTLTSPYGSGSSTFLSPEQMKNRKPATFDGKPAAQFFDDAARRQNRSFEVGGISYSPDKAPALLPGQENTNATATLKAGLKPIEDEDEKKAREFLAKQVSQPVKYGTI